jgi:hypothetical protein
MIERRLFGISAGLALAGSGAPVATASAQQTGASGRPDAQRAVAAFVAKYTDAYNRKDAAAVASLYTEDGIVVQPGPIHRAVHGHRAEPAGWADTTKPRRVREHLPVGGR